MTDARQPRIDLAELRAALVDRLEQLAEELLGLRNKARCRRSQWRWGANGSVSLEVGGTKRGGWWSHEAGEGGGPIELVAFARRCNFDSAVEWAARWAGVVPVTDADRARDHAQDELRQAERERQRRQREAEAAQDEAQRIASARRIWARTVPILGTPGERYLIAARGIPAPPRGWPACVGWLPAHSVTVKQEGPNGDEVRRAYPCVGAVVLAATLSDGSVTAVQRVYVAPDGGNVRRDSGHKIKLTLGCPAGAAARLPAASAGGPVLVAEGPETALSAWSVTGYATVVALGGIGNLHPRAGRQIVVCRDDDRPGSPADLALNRALAEWRQGGIDASVAQPWAERRGDKSDLNDTLRQAGAHAVRAQIAAAMQPLDAPRSPRRRSDHRVPAADPRRKETLAACFRLLRAQIPSDTLLARLHAQNADRTEPLPAELVNDLALWAASRPMRSAAHVG